MTTKTNPYTTAPTLVPDNRTPSEKLVDKMLEDGVVERRVAVKLATQRNELLAILQKLTLDSHTPGVWNEARALIAKHQPTAG